MSAPVFLVEPGELADVRVGVTFRLQGAEARHAGVVQRRGPGERIDLCDGCGTRALGKVVTAGSDGVVVEVLDLVAEPASRPTLVLVQALAKGDRDERAIEAATEVGVDAVLPWQARRSVVVWRGERAAKSRALWLGTVRAAAKQSRRAWVPPVEAAVDSKALTARVAATVAAGGAVLVLHEEAELPLAGAPLPADGEVLVVVGPEGGIDVDELDAFVAAGALAVRLGPHVLRTSTAGPVALGLLAQRLGRWG